MKEIKLVFTGSMGAGKTTAISAISEIPVINTDVRTIGEDAQRKKTTTAAMDYGELTLNDGNKLRVYGTPGQERFQYMWPIIIKGALGLIILVDDANSHPLKDLALFINYFRDHINKIPTVVGITRRDLEQGPNIQEYHDYLHKEGLQLPIFSIDARERENIILMIQALTAMVEFN